MLEYNIELNILRNLCMFGSIELKFVYESIRTLMSSVEAMLGNTVKNYKFVFS